MDKYNFKTHDEIPAEYRDYIMNVANADQWHISEIPLEDINNFLNGYEDWKANE